MASGRRALPAVREAIWKALRDGVPTREIARAWGVSLTVVASVRKAQRLAAAAGVVRL
jgi:DNA invertase Pin-like site-specific DNA recombinase